MPVWHSLFLPFADAAPIIARLQTTLGELGYESFDPFGLMPGKAYPRAVRLFVAPPRDGWVRVLGEPDAAQLAPLSELAPLLSARLDGAAAEVHLYAEGALAGAAALAAYLRPGTTIDAFAGLLAAPDLDLARSRSDNSLPLDALPDDVRALADNVNPRQAQAMFDRLTGSLLKRTGQNAETQAAARSLIAGDAPDWESAGGRRIRALLGCLTVPDDWREPDFVTLRDAYQVARRRQRRPDAAFYPGDAEALARVPAALDYHPVYGGKNA